MNLLELDDYEAPSTAPLDKIFIWQRTVEVQ